MSRSVLTAVAALFVVSACASHDPPRPQTRAEALADCKATAHSPLVALGIDPDRTTIVARPWTYDGHRRLGEYRDVSGTVKSVDHKEVLFHEYIHRGLRVAGFRLTVFSALFRDEEHQLIYHVLDRDFPGLQDWRIHPTLRQRATARWTSPEYAVRLADIERQATAATGWCRRNGK